MAGVLTLQASMGRGGFSVEISPGSLSGTGTAGQTITTDNAATATPQGGIAPYTYSWLPDGGSIQANQAAQATTTFTYLDAFSPGLYGGFATVTVTDSQGRQAFGTVTLSFTAT